MVQKSTHAKAGTAPSHSVKSKKKTPPNSQTPTDALPGSVSSAARKEGALASRLVLANLRSQFYSQTARRRKDRCRIEQM